ncbi:MAG: hypothetical protein H6924_06035 [Alphaproteobacteria bacterium]|nr:hypothetical protein [Alphaproteobacteria bacterium]
MVQWFGPKVPGFEMGVRSWQGWFAVMMFLVLMIGPQFTDFQALGLPHWMGAAIRASALCIFVPLFWMTYQKD